MKKKTLKIRVREAVQAIESRGVHRPSVAIILGSGLGGFVDALQEAQTLSVGDIPHYPLPSVPGHAGFWVFGRIDTTPILAIQGRVHMYEGYSLEEVAFPVHVAAGLGVKTLIVTTSCGGLNPTFQAGDLMLIRDHINFIGKSPLRGAIDRILGSRFVDLSGAYDPEWLQLARESANKNKILLREGTFIWMSGPNYETAAEVRMLHALGGDAVSMSTVPEVIAARQRRLRVLGIALITNPGTGLSVDKLSHVDVTACAQSAGEHFSRLLRTVLPRIGERIQNP
ncbi:purine-nucleoside phosphorylase [candidate division KSB1 bacterium]|nr:purine-nucleoside phosphorylase [candidate division KSB1 bacterium]